MKDLCKSCGAKIVWAKCKAKSGQVKNMPFDFDPDEGGQYYLFHPHGDTTRMEAKWIPPGGDWPVGSLPRKSHFATCPQRDEWRSGTRKR